MWKFFKKKKKNYASFNDHYADSITQINVPIEQQIAQICMNMAGLQLEKEEFISIVTPPGEGVVRGFGMRCKGGLWPTFTYIVFDAQLMEFIEVTVEVSRPDTIRYLAKIICEHKSESTHNKEVEIKEYYKAPFLKILKLFYFYFPLYNNFSHEKNLPTEKNIGKVAL